MKKINDKFAIGVFGFLGVLITLIAASIIGLFLVIVKCILLLFGIEINL